MAFDKAYSRPKKLCKNCGKLRQIHGDGVCDSCYQKAWYIKNRENHLKRCRERYYKKREQIRKYQNEYNRRPKVRIYIKKYKKEYRKRNREYFIKYLRNYHHTKKFKVNHIIAERIRAYGYDFVKNSELIRKLANHRCMKCGGEENGQVHDTHHIIPFVLIRNNGL